MKLSLGKRIAFTAMTCAILIAGQFAFYAVSGVEIVTVILVCFSYVAGAGLGMACAVAFSLLRCFIFGFHINVVILYLIYYPLLAAAFGALGKIKNETFENYPVWFAGLINLILLSVAGASLTVVLTDALNVSRLMKFALNILLWVIFALSSGLLIAFDVLFVAKKQFNKNTSTPLKLITFANVAAIFTVFFTFLDDVIILIFTGSANGAWLTYFYASFAAMLPQVICNIFTVSTLFIPLTGVMSPFFVRKSKKL